MTNFSIRGGLKLLETEMKSLLAQELSPKRFNHSLGVSIMAEALAVEFGEDPDKARIAGLLHDCARGFSNNSLLQQAEKFAIVVDNVQKKQPVLLHAPIGAKIAELKYGIQDREMLSAIECHTTGKAGMTLLDKIIYLADVIEPGRYFSGVDKLRSLAKQNLSNALLGAYDLSIKFVIDKGRLLHPDTVEGRNSLLFDKM